MTRWLIAALAALLSFSAAADEGMWTFDNPPRDAVRDTYGVDLTPGWLDRVRQGTVRLDNGCSGSFISAEGLVLTNHHCAEACIAQNSTAERDLLADGFLAGSRDEEARCQGWSISTLVDMENVTAKVNQATAGLNAAEAAEARRGVLAGLEKSCEEAATKAGAPLKCERLSLYQGGQYWLYKYKRYDDVRLAFAPERDIAAFGGDPDNFQFPRWCLDMSILRVYENGKPARTPNRLRFAWQGASEGDPVFVSGHPGNTDRLLTVAELKTQREAHLPFWLLRFAELRGRLIQYSKQSPEAFRTTEPMLNGIENAIKVRRKQFDALLDPALLAAAMEAEESLRAALADNRELAPGAANAWDDIAKAQGVWRDMIVRHTFIEGRAGFNTQLFTQARNLVRAAAERGKPNEKRLAEFTDTRLPALERGLKAANPVYPELEVVTLSYSLERMREWLGPDDEIVRAVLGRESPDAAAERLVKTTTLADPAARLALYEGGQAAIDASTDPMIRLAVAVDPAARALRKRFEDEVDGPTRNGQEQIAKARFAVLGTGVYPDATFTLRLSYGAMMGWNEKGEDVRPYTEMSRAFERATGTAPFRIPETWLENVHKIDMKTPSNFTTNNDIVGGNSGSAMLDRDGNIVGLAFDGNIHSISGSYWFDTRMNRTIGVHPRYMRLAMEEIYGAKALLKEIDAR